MLKNKDSGNGPPRFNIDVHKLPWPSPPNNCRPPRRIAARRNSHRSCPAGRVALKQLGRKGVADMIERCCRHAGRFAQGLNAAGYEILNDVVLNQVLVSFGDPQTTQKVIEGIQNDGVCWCGGTLWQGRTAMRISVSSWATTDRDVEMSLESMLRVASEPAG